MGLIKAGIDSFKGALDDAWREYFYCDSMDETILVQRGRKRKGKRSSNKGDENIITDGSIIAVNEGQCAIIVDQGAIIDICSEAGEYVYEYGSEPSILSGGLKNAINATFEQAKKRFVFGGEAPSTQRIYYFNLKEITGNRYGTPQPIPFRVVDHNIGLDMDITIRCNGEYSYKIVDPILFYKNVCGNVNGVYETSEIANTLKTELLTALQPAFAKISAMGVRYSSLPAHTFEICEALDEVLSSKWQEKRGIQIVSFGMNSVSASKEDEDMIKSLQQTATYASSKLKEASMAQASAEALKGAASNAGGAMLGFMNMNMAQQTIMSMQAQQPQPQQNQWTCSCGNVNTGKFCSNCGNPQPTTWTCSCGSVNTGKFCSNCGNPKPLGNCPNCGTKLTPGAKFCPECGKKL